MTISETYDKVSLVTEFRGSQSGFGMSGVQVNRTGDPRWWFPSRQQAPYQFAAGFRHPCPGTNTRDT